MRPTFLASVILLIAMLLLAGAVHAQTATMDEGTFWSDLQRTADALPQPPSAVTNNGALSEARALWKNVGSVRLSDGTVIAINIDWLTSGLTSTNPTELVDLRNTIQAILNYHQAHLLGSNNGHGSLDALDSILKDPRFQYTPTATPTPAPQQNNQPEGPSLISPVIAQALLFIIGGLIVAVLGLSFIRQLRIQRAAMPEQLLADDPTTSEDARDRAVGSEATQDFRMAIRYLYLASLLMLDEQGVIRYDRTLTNREHLRQVANNAELSDALRPVVNTFDRVWYGFAQVNEAMYEQFRQDVERLRNLAP